VLRRRSRCASHEVIAAEEANLIFVEIFISSWGSDILTGGLLLQRHARRQRLGAAPMRAADATARECSNTLLVLDASLAAMPNVCISAWDGSARP
jgi:hypothetical protein